jgi:pyruvate ferredoxin oxidoreductase alpha subunit
MKKYEGHLYITGNQAVAHGVRQCKPDVIAAYPITPQTTIIETLADFVAEGSLNAKMSLLESEHSAMAACIGASWTGARVFTATSSQGLLYMCEMLHWAARGRFPIVMAVANRGIAPSWTIKNDHCDAMSQRETGWIQIYASTVQEAYDSVIQAFKVAEDKRVLAPVMVNLDGFTLSHIMQPMELIPDEFVEEFVGEVNIPHRLDFENPFVLGSNMEPDDYMKEKKSFSEGVSRAKIVLEEIEKEFEKISGRRYGSVEKYRTDDAEVVFISAGTIAKEAEIAVDRLRERGVRAGSLRIRLLRPFPKKEIGEVEAEKIIVANRAFSPGSDAQLTQDVKAALFDAGNTPELVSVVCGLGGKEVTAEDFMKMSKLKGKEEVWWI